jgi:hypothetical protein
MAIPIAEHVKNLDKLRVRLADDGNLEVYFEGEPDNFVVVDPDFRMYDLMRPWAGVIDDPTRHLDYGDRCWLSRKLTY